MRPRLLSPYHDRQLVRFLNAVPPEVHLKSAKTRASSVQSRKKGCLVLAWRISARTTRRLSGWLTATASAGAYWRRGPGMDSKNWLRSAWWMDGF